MDHTPAYGTQADYNERDLEQAQRRHDIKYLKARVAELETVPAGRLRDACLVYARKDLDRLLGR